MGASTMGNGPPGGGPARRLWVFLLICSCALHARAVTPPPGVFYKTPSSIRSSSSCSSVVYYRGTRIGESTLYFLTEQVWDLERAVVYSPELEGCVQCSADRYFSIRPGEERFYAPAQCLLCGDGLMQDPAGTGCTYTTDQCLPPLIRTKGGICSCPPFTDLKPGNYCGCADPIAQTEYDTYDNVICLCPPETKFVNGQCLCPRPDQVYDPEHRWCKACPHPLVADGNRCVYRREPHLETRCPMPSRTWFHDEHELEDYVKHNVVMKDAGEEAYVDVYPVQGKCEKASVTLSANGAWGSSHKSLPVWYDPTCPVVNVTLRQSVLDWKHMGMTDVGFHLHVAHHPCDAHPNVSLTVYSDQVNIMSKHSTATVTPLYDAHGNIKDFQVFLRARHHYKCNAMKGRLCLNQDGKGRTYLLRVCVTTSTGCTACDVAAVSLAIMDLSKGMLKYKRSPLSLMAPPRFGKHKAQSEALPQQAQAVPVLGTEGEPIQDSTTPPKAAPALKSMSAAEHASPTQAPTASPTTGFEGTSHAQAGVTVISASDLQDPPSLQIARELKSGKNVQVDQEKKAATTGFMGRSLLSLFFGSRRAQEEKQQDSGDSPSESEYTGDEGFMPSDDDYTAGSTGESDSEFLDDPVVTESPRAYDETSSRWEGKGPQEDGDEDYFLDDDGSHDLKARGQEDGQEDEGLEEDEEGDRPGAGDDEDIWKSRHIVSVHGHAVASYDKGTQGQGRKDGPILQQHVGGTNAFYQLLRVEGHL